MHGRLEDEVGAAPYQKRPRPNIQCHQGASPSSPGCSSAEPTEDAFPASVPAPSEPSLGVGAAAASSVAKGSPEAAPPAAAAAAPPAAVAPPGLALPPSDDPSLARPERDDEAELQEASSSSSDLCSGAARSSEAPALSPSLASEDALLAAVLLSAEDELAGVFPSLALEDELADVALPTDPLPEDSPSGAVSLPAGRDSEDAFSPAEWLPAELLPAELLPEELLPAELLPAELLPTELLPKDALPCAVPLSVELLSACVAVSELLFDAFPELADEFPELSFSVLFALLSELTLEDVFPPADLLRTSLE